MIGTAEGRASRGHQAPLLVGRGRERILLRERFASVLAGQGNLVLIRGDPGIGKTALAEAFACEVVAQGALVLFGRCYDFTATIPYGLWIDLFRHYPEEPGLPALPAVVAQCGTAGGSTSQADLFARIVHFLSAVAARRPLLLFLDDLHCADPASIDLLHYLARQLATIPLLLVTTYRAHELTGSHPLSLVLPSLIGVARSLSLDLAPLKDGDARALVGRRYQLPPSDEARLVKYLRARAEGNPFFIGELLRALEEAGVLHLIPAGWTLGDLTRVCLPVVIKQVIAGRLARLGEEARTLLALAATIGQEVPLALWSAVAQVEEEALLALVERAVAAHLLVETATGTAVRFTHVLIREALYEGTLLARRRVWHRRIGEALLASPTPDPDTVAYHVQQAGDARAVAWLLQAAARAQRAYAWLAAAERFEAALALIDRENADARARGWTLLRLARMRRYDDSRAAVRLLEEAVRLATAIDDQVLQAYALFYLGLLRCFVRDYRQGIAEMEAGAAVLDRLSPAERAGVAALDAEVETSTASRSHHGTLAVYLAFVGRYADALRAATRALARPVDEPVEYADAYYALGLIHAVMGRPDEAHDAYTNARQGYGAARKAYLVAVVATEEQVWVRWSYWTDRLADWQALAAEAEVALARASGVRADLPPRIARLALLVLQGAWTEARQLALAVRASPSDAESFVAPAVLGPLLYQRGEVVLAWRLVRESLPEGLDTAPSDVFFTTALALQRLAALLCRDADELATARAWLLAHDRWLAWGGTVLGHAEGQLTWAHYYRAAGEPALARERAVASLAHATEPRQPLALLAAYRSLGQLDTEAERFTDAATHLDAALILAEVCAAPYERALVLLAQAELYERKGETALAGALVDEARAVCVPLGAAPALAQADALAARLATVKPAAPAYPAGLTAREVQVLRLIAAGHTNQQIAEALSVSKKTVMNHVAQILRKTNAANRAAAAVFALRLGLA